MAVEVHPVLQIVPLIVLLGLLIGYKGRRAHPILAGFIAAFLASIFAWGQLSINDISNAFMSGVNGIMFSSVLVYAATALFLAKIGTIKAFVDLVRKIFRKYGVIAVGVLVFAQGLAVYMAGHGAANTLVIGPLINGYVGWVPEVVAGLSIVSPVSWTTSPASAETGVTSRIGGIAPQQYANFMRPFTIIMWIVGITLAMYGAWRRGATATELPSELKEKSTFALFKDAFPFILFVILILIAPLVSLSSVIVLLLVMAVAILLVRPKLNEAMQWWVEANKPLLTYLFYAGTFLGFINVIALIGTFDTIAGAVKYVPAGVVVTVAIIIGYIIGVIAGAYTAMVMGIIHPILVAAGISWQALGFINYGIGLGAMMSPVQVNVSATAIAFNKEIIDVVRNNMKLLPFVLIIPIIMALAAL